MCEVTENMHCERQVHLPHFYRAGLVCVAWAHWSHEGMQGQMPCCCARILHLQHPSHTARDCLEPVHAGPLLPYTPHVLTGACTVPPHFTLWAICGACAGFRQDAAVRHC